MVAVKVPGRRNSMLKIQAEQVHGVGRLQALQQSSKGSTRGKEQRKVKLEGRER